MRVSDEGGASRTVEGATGRAECFESALDLYLEENLLLVGDGGVIQPPSSSGPGAKSQGVTSSTGPVIFADLLNVKGGI